MIDDPNRPDPLDDPTRPPPTSQGIAPPWATGPAPLAPGKTWQDLGPQTDPSGNTWDWDPGGNQWVQRGPLTTGTKTGGTPPPTSGGGGTPSPTVVQSNNPGIPGTPAPAPTPNLPEAPKVPAFTPPPAFFYDPFHAPTGQDVLNDPGYKVSFDEGQRAIGASAASRGTLNTGGTLKDYVTFGNNLASKTYGDIFSRDLQAYQVNRGNAIDAYNTNYGTQYKDPYTINYQTQYKDPFTANYTRAQDTYNAQQHNYDQDLYYKNHQGDQAAYYDLQYKLLNHQISEDDFRHKIQLLGFIQ